MDKFIARYYDKGIQRTVAFNKAQFDQQKAENWLKLNGIQNFFLFFEPTAPVPFDENNMLISGDVGFDITLDSVMDIVNSGKGIILKTYGGDLDEGLRIYDALRLLNLNPSIGVLGICASSGMQILLSTENRWATENSQGLIHNPWTLAMGDDAVFKSTAKDLEMSKLKLAKIYSEKSGKTVDEMLALMLEERFMDAKEMLALNFIKEIKTTITNNNEVKLNNDEMKNEKELTEKFSAIEAIVNGLKDGLKNLFIEPSKVKNVMLTNADGKQIDFPEVEDESQIAVGDKATIDGAPATGEHVMASGPFEGKTFVFDNGTLSEIKEPSAAPNEEMEALKAENAELKKQLEAQNAFKKSTETQIGELTKQLNEFKSLVTSGDENDKSSPEVQKTETKNQFVFKGKKSN